MLLDEDGNAVGVADKHAVHHAETPLHLAFSCYVLDADGRLLVTRRALAKATFPGVWTNSCCGHPAPGEDVEAAVVRRVGQELGLSLRDLRLVLPRFRYRAEYGQRRHRERDVPGVRGQLRRRRTCRPRRDRGAPLGAVAGVPRVGAGRA